MCIIRLIKRLSRKSICPTGKDTVLSDDGKDTVLSHLMSTEDTWSEYTLSFALRKDPEKEASS